MAIPANNTAPLFGEGASSTLRLVVYLIIAVALMIADRRGDWLERFRAAAGTFIEPIYRLAAAPSELARDARVALADRRVLTEQNAELSRQLLLAQTRLRRVEAVQEQNQRLQELLSVQKTLGLSVQLAKVIDVDTGASLPVGESGELCIKGPQVMKGYLGEGGEDKLVTSGLGGRFPADFPVGVVRSVGNDSTGMFAAAKATPDATLDRSAEVLVLHELANPVGPPAQAEEFGPPAALAGSDEPAPPATTPPAPAPVEDPTKQGEP